MTHIRYFPSQIDGATADWNPAPVDVLAMRSQGGLLRAEADKVLSVDAGFRPPPVPNGGHFLNVLASLREMGQVWQ